jgi:hypothetical protein
MTIKSQTQFAIEAALANERERNSREAKDALTLMQEVKA